MTSACWQESWVDKKIDEGIRKALADLFRLGVGVDEAKRELRLRAKGLQTFATRYMAEIPRVFILFSIYF
jgi:DNA replication ATP-dependent helicase Dna2